MIRVGGHAGLLIGGRWRPWSFQGYGAPSGVGMSGMAEVLTPPSIVAAIAAGYRPLVHPSALTGPLLAGSSLAGETPPGLRVHAVTAAS